MAILIDPPLWPAHGTVWSHLVSDSSLEELHVFAGQLGIARRSFDIDHYDVPVSMYEEALSLGAFPVSGHELIGRLRRSGLRVRVADRSAVRASQRSDYMWSQWQSLRHTPGFEGVSPQVWAQLGDDLLGRWRQPHRRYHDERHLHDVLLSLDQLAQLGETVTTATWLAAWFHDAVYAGSPTDEEESARLAVTSLVEVGADDGLASRVGGLILGTNPAEVIAAPPPELATLLDADLWIFASADWRYEEYSASVRAEYAHVPAPDFAAGRSAILRRYLARPHIYFTVTARERWENRARANLTAEIAALGA